MEYSPSSSTGSPRPSASDEESCCYSTVSSAPPKRRAGRTKFRETRHPVFKGVRRRGGAGRWVCEVREPNKKSRIWLGTFPTAEMAARAHDVAALALRGRSACLNFADSAWRLAVPASASPRDIQLAAANAAEEFRPQQQAPLSEPDEGPSAMEPTSELSSLSRTVTVTAPAAMVGIGEAFDAMEFGGGDYYSRMAEALLLDPPPAPGTGAGGGGCYWDDLDCPRADVSLWSYSI